MRVCGMLGIIVSNGSQTCDANLRILAKAKLVGAKIVKGKALYSPALGRSSVPIASSTNSLRMERTLLVSFSLLKPMLLAKAAKLSFFSS